MNKLFILFFSLAIFAFVTFANLEPSVTYAVDDTKTASLEVTSQISLSGCSDITMTAINMTQQSSIGSSTCNVKTNDTDGYVLQFKATATPALVSGSDFFTDFATTSLTDWTEVGGSEMKFGFSAYGTDVPASWKGTATDCGTAGADAYAPSNSMKHLGFYTTATTTTSRSSETTPSGVDTTLCVAAEVGDSIYAPSGTYVATIVATAVTQ